MDLAPRLVPTAVPDDPAGVVLVLHGGGARRAATPVSPTQLSVVRMVPVARRIARAGGGRLAVYRLLNTTRGWDEARSPVEDVAWALDEIAHRSGERRPTCLVGHSLGGRAALLAAPHRDEVRGVVALAPWVYPTDAPDDLGDRRVLVVHGSEDRIARPERSAAVVGALEARGVDVGEVTVAGARHAMLRHGSRFERLAADFAVATLLGRKPTGTLARIAGGERRVVL